MKKNVIILNLGFCLFFYTTINSFCGLDVTKLSGAPTTNVVIKQTKQDGSGCTSIRYTSNKDMITDTRTGDSIPVPFRAPDRDLGQTFKAPENMKLDAIVIRIGPTAETAEIIGAHISLQLLEVSGKESLHTMGTSAKTDDYTTGEIFKHILVARGGIIPSGIKVNDYLKFDLTGSDEIQLVAGKQYAFMLMLDNIAGSGVKLCLANTFMASNSYPDGHGIRREGGCGSPNAPEYSPDFCNFDLRLQRPPSTFGHPDVCTYRDLVFFLIKGTLTDNQPPIVSINNPSNNTNFNSPATIKIDAIATDPDGSISKVEFYNGSTKLGESTTTPYTFTWNNITEGSYTLKAIAFDNLNANTTSNTIVVNVINSISYYILPGKIEAENYSTMFGVKLETTSDSGGGKNIGYIETGDWIDYSIKVKTAGLYNISYRIASKVSSGKLKLQNGNTTYHEINIPNTTDYQKFTTISSTATLDTGIQTLRIFASVGGWNINWYQGLLNIVTDKNQTELENLASVYPVPTNGKLTIKGVGLNCITVYNDLGNTILNKITTNDDVEIDISNEATGYYFIEIISKIGKIQKKIIKY